MLLAQVDVRSRTGHGAGRETQTGRRRRWQVLVFVLGSAVLWPPQPAAASGERPQLRAAAAEFAIVADANAATSSRVGARAGNGVKIMAHVYIPSTTVIGSMVFIGPGTTFLNDKYPMRRAAPVEGARIEDHVTIGGGVTICPGATIGRNAFIAAGAVVTKDVPPDTLACGVPARHQPLPAALARGNLPELLLPQTDLWGVQSDDSWKE